MRVLAMVCLGIAGFVAYEALHARPDQRLIAYLLSTTMVLGSAYLVLEIFFVRIRFYDAAIYTFSPWRGARKIPWPAITGHSYSTLWHWHILETRGYGKVRLSFYLSGLGGLRDALISKLGESFREALICEVDEEDDHQD